MGLLDRSPTPNVATPAIVVAEMTDTITPIYGVSVSDAPGANQNDYSPIGYVPGVTNCLILNPSVPITITGIVAPTVNWSVLLINISVNLITLTNADSGSQSLNQFLLPDALSAALPGQGRVLLTYIPGLNWGVS